MEKRIEKLEMEIKGLENDLDELAQQLENTKEVGKAVREIQEFLIKQSNGYDVQYYPCHTLRR